MRTKLFRKDGYWAAFKAWMRYGVCVLHEDAECIALRNRRSIGVSLFMARLEEKAGKARLCKRCGGMKQAGGVQ